VSSVYDWSCQIDWQVMSVWPVVGAVRCEFG
jgi:hypothetical protein